MTNITKDEVDSILNEKDYYKILKLPKTADNKEIEKAHRKLSSRWHPDKLLKYSSMPFYNNAKQVYTKLNEIKDILSDKSKRHLYDTLGELGLKNSQFPYFDENVDYSEEDNNKNKNNTNEDYGDIDNLFSEPDYINNVKTKPVEVYHEITLYDLYKKYTVFQKFSRQSICKLCKGNGTEDGLPHKCKTCHGIGFSQKNTYKEYLLNKLPEECVKCKGLGIDNSVKKCFKCNGKKFTTENHELEFVIPAGANSNIKFQLENIGNEYPEHERKYTKHMTRSPVIVGLIELKHPIFSRAYNGLDLLLELNITFEESCTYLKRTIKLISGKEHTFVINNFIRHGDIYCLENAGMPDYRDASKFGNLYIKFFVLPPKDLTKNLKKILWAMFNKSEYIEPSDKEVYDSNLILTNNYKFRKNTDIFHDDL